MRAAILGVPILLAAFALPAGAYGIPTHQELVDLVWDDALRPLLLLRFPGLTGRQLDEARAYAYGGAVIQDMGYYPVGHRFFSDLTHYVRSGDFVAALFQTAHDPNELAFAAGALSHYVGDSIGHSEAVNPAMGIILPNLVRKFGSSVTYEDAPIDHSRVEFGFDVAQIARHRYAPLKFRRRIGFRVAKAALNRALQQTYGLSLRETLGHPRFGSGSYRFTAREVVPLFARAEVVLLHDDLPPEQNDEAFRQYLESVDRVARSGIGAGMHDSPGARAHILAFVFSITPRIGVLRVVDIKPPTTQTEAWFVRSLNHSEAVLSAYLKYDATDPAHLGLADLDLDTGAGTAPGRYALTDETYAKLLDIISMRADVVPPPGLVRDILAYYSDPGAPITTKKHPQEWSRVNRQLGALRSRYPEVARR